MKITLQKLTNDKNSNGEGNANEKKCYFSLIGKY